MVHQSDGFVKCQMLQKQVAIGQLACGISPIECVWHLALRATGSFAMCSSATKLSSRRWGERMVLSLAVVVVAVALISASAIVVDYTQQSVGTALMRGR